MTTTSKAPKLSFKLRCQDVYKLDCVATFDALTADQAIHLVRLHGRISHGITPDWFTDARIRGIEASMTVDQVR